MRRIGLVAARLGIVITAAIVIVVGFAMPASAHRLNESYVYFDVLPNGLEGRFELRVGDINEVLDLDIPDDPDAALDALDANLDELHSYAGEHLAITGEGQAWPVTFTDVDYLDTESGPFAILNFDVAPTISGTPRSWDVTLDPFFAELPDNRAIVLIGSYWDAGVFNNESDEFAIFSPGETTQTINVESPSWFKGFRQTVILGIDHIEIGTDHILFILVLLLPAVLVSGSGSWVPIDRFGTGLWRVLKIATMFTIAHSITLTLGGLGWINLPGKPIETIIAFSIIAAAAHNIWPRFHNKEWLIAFGFGLIHGFGFASLLADLGLDRTRRFSSLLGFNIGVELGQLVIIALVFPILFVLRRTRLYRWILVLGSALMAIVAFLWMIERIFETSVPVVEFMDRALKWPRVLLPLAVAAAFAVWFERRERARGALIATTPADAASIEEPLLESSGV